MQREHHPKNLKTVPAGNQNSLIKKASAQNGAKALKIMRFLGLVASQRELLPLAPCKSIINTFVYEIYQRVSILFELSVKHTLSDFLLPYRCHKNYLDSISSKSIFPIINLLLSIILSIDLIICSVISI